MGPGGQDRTTVRRATAADADAIARVHTTSWRETYGRLVEDVDTDPWFALGPRTTMWHALLAEGTDAVVAVGAGDVVGFAATTPTAEPDAVRPEELTMLYVLAAAHGTGVGQALLDAALGGRPASLWVAADNPRAHAFYRRNGFTPDGAESSFGPMTRTVRLVR